MEGRVSGSHSFHRIGKSIVGSAYMPICCLIYKAVLSTRQDATGETLMALLPLALAWTKNKTAPSDQLYKMCENTAQNYHGLCLHSSECVVSGLTKKSCFSPSTRPRPCRDTPRMPSCPMGTPPGCRSQKRQRRCGTCRGF